MTILNEKLRQMRETIDTDVMRHMMQPPDVDSPIARDLAILAKCLKDEADLMSGKLVALPDGRFAVRLPIPYDACAVFSPLTMADLVKATDATR